MSTREVSTGTVMATFCITRPRSMPSWVAAAAMTVPDVAIRCSVGIDGSM